MSDVLMSELEKKVGNLMRFPDDKWFFDITKTTASHAELHDNIIICYQMAYEIQVFINVS